MTLFFMTIKQVFSPSFCFFWLYGNNTNAKCNTKSKTFSLIKILFLSLDFRVKYYLDMKLTYK